MYYGFSFGEWLLFCFQDIVNSLEIVVRQSAFSGGDDFVVGVGPRCGDHFLGTPDPYNFAPAAFYAILF